MAIAFPRSMAALAADSSRRSTIILAVAFALLGAWGAWFLAARVELYERTPTARLEVSRASHPVQAPLAGQVVTSRLTLDRVVRAGELLVALDAAPQKLELEEARSQHASLAAQLDSLRRTVAAEERALAVARSAGHEALKEARAKLKEQQVESRFADDKARRLGKLRRGGQMAEIDYLRVETQAARSKAAVDTLRIAASRRRGEQRTDERDRFANVEKLRAEATRIAGELATVTARIERLKHDIGRRAIRAPVAGRLGQISDLAVGSYVKEGDRLATIIPEGRLTAVAHFKASAAIGRLRAGQRGLLRFHGFPWTQYGTVAATVRRVAQEASGSGVRVELDVHPTPESPIPLQHGMPAEVEVVVERVSPVELALRAAGKLVMHAADDAPGAAGGAPALPRQPERR